MIVNVMKQSKRELSKENTRANKQTNKHKIKSHKSLKAGGLVLDIYFQIIKQNFMFSPREKKKKTSFKHEMLMLNCDNIFT